MLNRVTFRHFNADLLGGVTTAIVSLPLALAFGVASGAGPQVGLYGAVCVGLFAALFGGTSRLISEPTGPMTVIMTAVISSLMAAHPEDGLAMAFTVVMVAGLFQMLMGGLKLGQFVQLMPYTVISGFMSGIGIILILLQLPPFLGYEAPPGGVLPILRALPEMLRNLQYSELALGLGGLVLLLVFPRKWRSYCPPQLLVLILGALAAAFLLPHQGVNLIGRIPMGLPEIQVPTFTADQLTRILVDGIVLGTLGAIDTLLTAMIADSLTRDHHNADKELFGQGLGNLVSGLCGGLPGAGATMGTVVNIQTGARTILAGIIRALLLLIVVLWAAPLVSGVPMAILAAIALKVGLDILDWSFMKRVSRVSRTNTAIMYGVLLLTVFVDLIVAVGVGVFIANMLTIRRLSLMQEENVSMITVPAGGIGLSEEQQRRLESAAGQILLFHLSGPMIFGVAKAIAREHAAMHKARVLIIDLSDVPFLGITVTMALENMITDAIDTGARVMVAGAQKQSRELLRHFDLLDEEALSEFSDRTAALEAAFEVVQQEPRG